MKVVINVCYGGFGLSHKAMMMYAELKGLKLFAYTADWQPWDGEGGPIFIHYTTKPVSDGEETNSCYFSDRNITRDDPELVKVVETLGSEANGGYAKLKVIEIPNGIEWEIDEYDGWERVDECHRSWS
jgi:hypothetical protein